MHKNAPKCNETLSKWCKNKRGASKIINTFETYQLVLSSVYVWLQGSKFLETVLPATSLLTWLGDKRPPFCQAMDRARGNPKTKLGADRGGGVGEAAGFPREGGAHGNSRMRREGQRLRACERAEDGGVCDQDGTEPYAAER
jgi:hypothetical protein